MGGIERRDRRLMGCMIAIDGQDQQQYRTTNGGQGECGWKVDCDEKACRESRCIDKEEGQEIVVVVEIMSFLFVHTHFAFYLYQYHHHPCFTTSLYWICEYCITIGGFEIWECVKHPH